MHSSSKRARITTTGMFICMMYDSIIILRMLLKYEYIDSLTISIVSNNTWTIFSFSGSVLLGTALSFSNNCTVGRLDLTWLDCVVSARKKTKRPMEKRTIAYSPIFRMCIKRRPYIFSVAEIFVCLLVYGSINLRVCKLVILVCDFIFFFFATHVGILTFPIWRFL